LSTSQGFIMCRYVKSANATSLDFGEQNKSTSLVSIEAFQIGRTVSKAVFLPKPLPCIRLVRLVRRDSLANMMVCGVVAALGFSSTHPPRWRDFIAPSSLRAFPHLFQSKGDRSDG